MRISAIVAVMMVLAAQACFQDGPKVYAAESAEGTVSSVDWVGSVIVVDDVRYAVPQDAAIYKGEDAIGLSDINVGDRVTVSYYDDPAGVRKAALITVEYSGDFPV